MKRHIGDSTQGAQLFDPVSPLRHAAAIRAPVLLMHGREDTRVPIAHGRRMRDALEANNKDVTWVVFNEEGHGLHYQYNQNAYYEAVFAFLGKHLPVTSAPARPAPPDARAPRPDAAGARPRVE